MLCQRQKQTKCHILGKKLPQTYIFFRKMLWTREAFASHTVLIAGPAF